MTKLRKSVKSESAVIIRDRHNERYRARHPQSPVEISDFYEAPGRQTSTDLTFTPKHLRMRLITLLSLHTKPYDDINDYFAAKDLRNL